MSRNIWFFINGPDGVGNRFMTFFHCSSARFLYWRLKIIWRSVPKIRSRTTKPLLGYYLKIVTFVEKMLSSLLKQQMARYGIGWLDFAGGQG